MVKNKLCVNPSKIKAMIVSSNYSDFDIRYYGSSVDIVSNMECLGVIHDDRLSFAVRIYRVVSRTSSVIRRLYNLT